jgi:L-lactate dehydrogenase (cytochrome)
MRIDQALNIEDLRRLAKQRLPRMVFDYIDGGADDEITLHNNTARLRAHGLHFKALVDVSKIDLSARIMGSDSSLPFFISPTAASRLFHPREGERAVARAAQAAGTIYSLSTLGSVSIEEVAALCPGPKWFQVYAWRDRSVVEAVLKRAATAGFAGLILTVDTPVAGNRERDPRNAFTIPPRVSLRTALQALARPNYLFDIATTSKIAPANFPDPGLKGGIMEFINSQFDRSIDWSYARWLKDVWKGPVAIKGISRADDVERAISAGADAVWVSNHGGRQLDTSLATIDTLPAISAAAKGRVEVIFDGGVRRGTDIIKALALGASGVAIGRAYIYGLAAGGESGVRRAIEILKSEVERNMALMGARNVNAIDATYVVAP